MNEIIRRRQKKTFPRVNSSLNYEFVKFCVNFVECEFIIGKIKNGIYAVADKHDLV